MSEYERLDDIEKREHRDLREQWIVGLLLAATLSAVVIAILLGP